MSNNRKDKQSDSKLVAFKLDDENRAKLSALAERLGTKRNLAAKDLVIGALNGQLDTQEGIIILQQQIFALREELALVAEALLTHAGKLNSSEARRWVDKNVKPGSSPEDDDQP